MYCSCQTMNYNYQCMTCYCNSTVCTSCTDPPQTSTTLTCPTNDCSRLSYSIYLRTAISSSINTLSLLCSRRLQFTLQPLDNFSQNPRSLLYAVELSVKWQRIGLSKTAGELAILHSTDTADLEWLMDRLHWPDDTLVLANWRRLLVHRSRGSCLDQLQPIQTI